MTYSLIIVVVWILWCYCFINSCMCLFLLKICILRYTWLYSNTIKNCNYHCIFHFGYNSSGESRLVGLEIIQITSEKIWLIRERIQTTQSRQKSYADCRRRDLEFAVGGHVFLKVSPWKGIMRFGHKGKLSPRYIGPFEILECVGLVAYRIALPPALSKIHNVFHISSLRKYIPDPSHTRFSTNSNLRRFDLWWATHQNFGL